MPISQLPRIRNCSPSDIWHQYIVREQPIVIEDACNSWPAVAKWDSKYLISVVGDVGCPILDVSLPKNDTELPKMEICPLHEYLARLPSAKFGDPYLQEAPVKRLFPQLLEDLGPPCYSREGSPDYLMLLSARSYSPLHFHRISEAVSYQIAGTRRFLLVPPSETSKLDPLPKTGRYYYRARREVKESEIDTLDVSGFQATLAPGEAVYIPVHWWHAVYGGDNLSILLVDFFYSPPARWPESENASRVHGTQPALLEEIRSLKNRIDNCKVPKEQLSYWDRIFHLACTGIVDREVERQFLLDALERLPQTARELRDYASDRLSKLVCS